jgi:hypothetical protein
MTRAAKSFAQHATVVARLRVFEYQKIKRSMAQW